MSFAEMLAGLAAAEVRFVVIGGVAATAHGSTYVTNDLDICYDPAVENVDRLARLLASWGAYPRGIDAGLPFIMDARTFRAAPVMTLSTRLGAIDVFDRVEGVGSFADVLRASEEFDAFDTRFRVLGLRALIAAKRAAGRPKDFAQLPELQGLLALTEERARTGPAKRGRGRE